MMKVCPSWPSSEDHYIRKEIMFRSTKVFNHWQLCWCIREQGPTHVVFILLLPLSRQTFNSCLQDFSEEISLWFLELAIWWSDFSRSRHLSPAESPKSVLVPICAPNTGTDRLAMLSAETRTVRGTGPDGPRLGAEASPLPISGRSAMAQRVFSFTANLDLASWEGPCQGGEILECV
jgi:hypothetical protein